MIDNATVKLWGNNLGALYLNESERTISFQYFDNFEKTGYQVSPIKYPYEKKRVFQQRIPRDPNAFNGLPGFIADVLPDKWGTALMDRWLAENGRDPGTCNVIERLLYMGSRGMGALEFVPEIRTDLSKSIAIKEIEGLVKAAADILSDRAHVSTNLEMEDEALKTIISIGTSAGGARAKAVIAYNDETGEIRSGQVDAPEGFEHFLLKLDGVTNSILGDPEHFGSIEYSYYRIANDCDIDMMPSQLLPDRNRKHFLTKRYDRIKNRKIHKVSLCGINHMDYNLAGYFSYEQMFSVMRDLGLKHDDLVQGFKRMVFNVIGRNQDDHTKNVEFLMDEDGNWRLAPAFDMTYAFKTDSPWVSKHQMTINGKNDNFVLDDLLKIANENRIKNATDIVEGIRDRFLHFEDYMDPDIPEERIQSMKATLRTSIS